MNALNCIFATFAMYYVATNGWTHGDHIMLASATTCAVAAFHFARKALE